MARQTVKTIFHPDARRRVDIFRRDDGLFGFVELIRYDRPEGNYWALLPPWSTITDTVDAAEREARSSIPWLIGISK
jgi:hypothetical protein